MTDVSTSETDTHEPDLLDAFETSPERAALAAVRLERELADPSNYGMAKSFMMSGLARPPPPGPRARALSSTHPAAVARRPQA